MLLPAVFGRQLVSLSAGMTAGEPPRWAQAENCTGGHRPAIANVLKTGTKVTLP